MYTFQNFRTKKDLKAAVARGEEVFVYQPGGIFARPARDMNGRATVEGPHYPEPHRFYAEVVLVEGRIVKVK